MLYFFGGGCCAITLWGLRNCSTSSVVTLGFRLAVSCKQPTLSPNKIPWGIRPICDARQYFVHMCILHPSLYSCAHTSAISSLLKARALQHEVDVQSHLSSCVLQLEELKVVFQISKLFRCQIFIAAQHMASWLLVVFCFFFPSDCSLRPQAHGPVSNSFWCYCTSWSPQSDYALILCTYCCTWLEDGILCWQINNPSAISFVTNWTHQKQGLLSFPEVSRNTSIRTRCCRNHYMQQLFSLWPVLLREILEANVPNCSERRTKWSYLQYNAHITVRKKRIDIQWQESLLTVFSITH